MSCIYSISDSDYIYSTMINKLLAFSFLFFLTANVAIGQKTREFEVKEIDWEEWEKKHYFSYFSEYYYGYYRGYGASELGLEVGHKGWNFDLITWIRDQYGAGIGYATGYKGENGLSFIFAYGFRPSWQAHVAPVVRFIPATLEEEKKIGIGFDVDVVYYYFKDIGFKAGYGSTTGFSVGATLRVNNVIFER